MIYMEFKDLLIKFRNRSGIGKKELASILGMKTGNYLGDIESGRTQPPNMERCRQIADALKLNDKESEIFIRTAAEERSNTEELEVIKNFKKQPLHELETINSPDLAAIKVNKVPVISFVHANQFMDVVDPFPVGMADEYVYTDIKGKNIFALRVYCDCMMPEFNEGDIIVVKPNEHVNNGDFVVVKDSKAEKATFKQYKKFGKTIILHPLNPKFPDIVLDHDDRYTVIGKVVAKVKKY